MPNVDKKRGNDHGFLFTRVRSSNKPANGQVTPIRNENKPDSLGNKRHASSESSPRLDFPEAKRRIADTSSPIAVEEVSVPVKKAPQPTPLISRTRTRVSQPATPTSSRRRADGSSRPRAVGRKSTLGRRRSTFSMRGKRASSIGGGFKATPHESVAAGDFYRHISPELPEPIRLRQLLAWCARRTASDVASDGWPGELPGGVRRVLDDALREAVDDMHSAFEKGAIATSWYHRPVDQTESLKEPLVLAEHPENLVNRDARDRLLKRVEILKKEDAAWVRELKRAGAEHARALARLPMPVQALPANNREAALLQPIAVAAPAEYWECLAEDDALRYVELASGGAVEAQLAESEAHVDRAVGELEIALDAFHLDAHRAAQDHAHAVETCARVAGDLGFAFSQRRAQAQVAMATGGPAKDEEKDCTRDLLQTLAAALAHS
ncbi:hypothetical protein IW152_004759 [Coemansia sp. BCRC 34962]|nr:hypothetical protein IW152_004759 [Coemansia sp. BCRC 34962]